MREKCVYMSERFYNQILTTYFSTMRNTRTAREYYANMCFICEYTQKDFLDITYSDANNYYEYLTSKKAHGALSRKTIKTRFYCYSAVAKFIINVFPDDLKENAFASIEKPMTSDDINVNRIPTLEEIDAILSKARRDDQFFLILIMISRMGLSVTQVVTLKKNMIVMVEEDIYLCYRKNEAETYMKVPEDVKKYLTRYLSGRKIDEEDTLFYNEYGNPMTIRNLDARLRKYVKESNINTPCSMKDLRNRAIMELVHAGATTEDIEQYTGLQNLRVRHFCNASKIIKIAPTDLVNYRII